jgi:hypothetical protein
VLELRSGYNGVSLAVQNQHDSSVEVTIELKVLNAVSHNGDLKATKTIRRGVLLLVVGHMVLVRAVMNALSFARRRG